MRTRGEFGVGGIVKIQHPEAGAFFQAPAVRHEAYPQRAENHAGNEGDENIAGFDVEGGQDATGGPAPGDDVHYLILHNRDGRQDERVNIKAPVDSQHG